MSLSGFQRALVELTLCPKKARRILRGEEGLEQYELSPLEAERLHSVLRQPGMSLNCTVARANRFEAIGEVFPMTCVLLEPVLRSLLDDLWDAFLPTDYQFSNEENLFASMVRLKIDCGELQNEYLEEILDYELACWDLARRMRYEANPINEAEVTFRHAPDLLLAPLSNLQAPPPDLPSGNYRARVRLTAGRFDVEMI